MIRRALHVLVLAAGLTCATLAVAADTPANADPHVLSGIWATMPPGGPRGGGPGPAAGRDGAPPAGPPAAAPPPPPPPAAGGPPGLRPPPGRGGTVPANRVAPIIKPEYLAQIPQGTMAPNQVILRNDDAKMLCIPDGYYGSGGLYPNLIIQTAKQITLINEENHRQRRIYLDHEHPKNPVPSYAGHSIGHWEGDTLVVHTIGLRERDEYKNPPGYFIVERLRKINGGKQLEYVASFHSDAYEKPGTFSAIWTYRPELHLQEEICEQFSDNFDDKYFQGTE